MGSKVLTSVVLPGHSSQQIGRLTKFRGFGPKATIPAVDNRGHCRRWVKLYWGGADKVMCAGTAVIDELVDACLTYSRPPM
jgi:hypothetical protein